MSTFFQPTPPSPLDPNDALADVESSFATQGVPAEILVVSDPAPVIGRGWAFDFARGSFVQGASGPLPTHGTATLLTWCEKALRTPNASSPIYPPGYGIVRPDSLIAALIDGAPIAEFEARIKDALTFHPNIADITDFATDFDPNDEWVALGFTIVRDDGSQVPVETVLPLTIQGALG